MAPRKKCDFFNGGRGVDFSADYSSSDDKDDSKECLDSSSSLSGLSSPESAGYSSSPASYSASESCSSPPPPPPAVYDPTRGCSPHAFHEYSAARQTLDAGRGPLGTPTYFHPSYRLPLQCPLKESYRASELAPSEEGRAKRQQKCRLCANHGLTVEVKGHKWYCPHKSCACRHCDITRKRQFYMKEQLKITRSQLHREGLQCLEEAAPPPPPPPHKRGESSSREPNPLKYPRLEEMAKETANIIDLELFDRINQICRPRSGQ